MGVPGHAMANREAIFMRQEGNLIQYGLVNCCWLKLVESDTGQFILDIFKYVFKV